ncbi:hypothetical protein BDR07DRAFT_1611301, partial [Suillus spraguei]
MFQDQDQNTTPQDTFHAQSPARIMFSKSPYRHIPFFQQTPGFRMSNPSKKPHFRPSIFSRDPSPMLLQRSSKRVFLSRHSPSNHPPAPQTLAQTLHLPSHSHSSRTSSQ